MVETEGRNSQKCSLQESDFCELAEYTEKLGLQGRLGSYSVMSALCWERPGSGLYPVQKSNDQRRRVWRGQTHKAHKEPPVQEIRKVGSCRIGTHKVVSGEGGREAVEPQLPLYLTRTNSNMRVHWTLDHLHV